MGLLTVTTPRPLQVLHVSRRLRILPVPPQDAQRT